MGHKRKHRRSHSNEHRGKDLAINLKTTKDEDRNYEGHHHRHKRHKLDSSRTVSSESPLNSSHLPHSITRPSDLYEKIDNDAAEDSDDELADYDWNSHQHVFDELFFDNGNYIRKGTSEYNDFFQFFQRYRDFWKRSISKKMADDRKKTGTSETFDRINKLNVRLSVDPVEKFEHWLYRNRREKHTLTAKHVRFYYEAVLHYIDFLQKQKFNKLLKIRNDQRNLPIYEHKRQIIDCIRTSQVVLVAGDTGCGKSTQVPQYLLESDFTNIACTQPRRIACMSLAKRVSYETLNEYGSQVAFQVRFEKSRSRATRILFLTEGLLLRQISVDPLLTQYNVIVIDEVHERHIHTDFLLGVLKCILHQRAELKLVLMSATINIELFSNYFDNVPVCKVPGRLYPIHLNYLPPSKEELARSEKFDPAPYVRVLQAIDSKYPKTERGDVLMFLAGMSEIMSVVEAAKMYAQKSKRWIVLPLHSSLSIAEQDKIFDFPPEGIRKCIVSTNIAETSVTIDGIRFVVDSGKVKEMSIDTKYNMQRLQEFWISRASAEQRKGRAGRTGPGVCYRLYSPSDYDAFQEYSTPEIHRVSLESLVLQMSFMGLPDARKFPFIEPPSEGVIESTIAALIEQGALTDRETLTSIGEMLAQLPVDVVIGKMLITGSLFDLIEPILTITASLSVQSIYTNKAHRDFEAAKRRKDLESDHGDAITLLNVYNEWISVKTEGSDSRRWCRRRGIEEQRLYEISKLRTQFRQLLGDYGMLRRNVDREHENKFSTESTKSADRQKLSKLKKEQRIISKKKKVPTETMS